MDTFDICIVGAGMAGASLAAELAPHARVLVIEGEDRPGYHATGRSAANWHQSYGGAVVQPLTDASGPFLREHGFLHPRGALTIAREGAEARLTAFADEFAALGVQVEVLARADLERRIPGLLPGWTLGALEPDCSDIDVAALHQHYLAAARRRRRHSLDPCLALRGVRRGRGVALRARRRARVRLRRAGRRRGRVGGPGGTGRRGAPARHRPAAPHHRASCASPRARPPSCRWCSISTTSSTSSPRAAGCGSARMDETPCAPGDAAPEELDVALAIDRLGGVVDWRVERVEHRWAGLRSFAPDRLPVYGFDRFHPRFFWFAGQGGFGIQTAPAAARLAAGLILGKPAGAVDPAPYSPWRFS